MEQNIIVEKLLEEFKEQRDALKEMITDLEKIKTKVDTLFPDNLTKRSVMYFEQKVKATTELFKALLDMRKEITKGVKDEIEIRRKVIRGEEEDIETLLNIREITRRVENLQKKKEKVEDIIKDEDPMPDK